MNPGASDLNHADIIMSLKQPRFMSLGLEIEKRARENPDDTFIIFADQKFTYKDFNQLCNRYADIFNRQGLKKGEVVILLMNNCPEYLAIVAGLSKLGVVPALVNTGVRGETLAHDINLVDARAVIVQSGLLDAFQNVSERIRLRLPALIFAAGLADPQEISTPMESLDAMLEAASEQNPDTTGNISSEDLLAIIYTAGNSGPRKAVPVLHKRWLITGHQACLYGEIIPGRVIYTVLPLYFNNVFNICFASTLLAGACMVLKKKFSVSRFWQDIRSHGVTHFMAVGEMCDYIYSQPEKPEDSDNPLRYLLSNALPPELAAAFKSRYAIEHVIEIYSTTEGVGSFVNIDEIPGMCGRLTANGIRQGEVAKYDFAQGRLAADDNHRLIKCQPGEIGILLCEINELYDFTGYINDWEATREKIMHSVFQDGDRYYRTDDLVKLHPDDYFAFIDRLGETYRWMGETVSANDVADVIGKFFGGIDEVLVFGVRIPGYTGRCGMAAIRILPGESLDWKGFTKHINNRLPEHSRPNFIRVCPPDDCSLEEMKNDLKMEGYYPGLVNDPLFYLDHSQNIYLPLTPDIYNLIMEEKVRF